MASQKKMEAAQKKVEATLVVRQRISIFRDKVVLPKLKCEGRTYSRYDSFVNDLGRVGATEKTAIRQAFDDAVRHWQAMRKLSSRGNDIAHPETNISVDDVLYALQSDYGGPDAVRQLFSLTKDIEEDDN